MAALSSAPPALPRLPRPRVFVALALAIYAVELLILRLPRAEGSRLIALAAATDLTLVVPALFWFLVLRPSGKPVVRALPVFLLSLVGARLVLPADVRSVLTLERFAVAPLELVLMAWVIVKVRRTARGLRGADHALDVPERISIALADAFPYRQAGELLATEFSMLFYALASWRRAPHVPDGAVAHFYHRKTGLAAMLGALTGAATVELFVVHLLVHARHPSLAWWLAVPSAFGVLWLLGLTRAAVLRPVLTRNGTIHVRSSVQWRVDIPRDAIAKLETGRGVKAPAKGAPGALRAMPIAQPNVLVTLTHPLTASGMYGRRREVSVLALALDDPAAFRRAVEA